MNWQGIGRATALAVAIVLALVFAACGGSDDAEPDSPDAPAASEPSASEDSAAQGAEKEKKDREDADAEKGSDDANDADDVAEEESADGGDKDSGRIEDIGEPATDEEREAMITAVKSYFQALADNDPAEACSWLASDTIDELERLFEQSEIEGDCEAFLQYAAGAFSQKDAPDFSAIKFSRFRVDGDRGVAFYKVPKRPRSFIVTAREPEGWRVAGIDGTPKP